MSQTASILAENVYIGIGTTIHPSVRISGPDGEPAKRIAIGDHCYIGEGVQIRCSDFEIGDFGKIHHQTSVHGYLPCRIGHNAWIGQFCIIDSIGGTTIGDNCGIGAHSQLWSHIKFGDTLDGCRFLSEKPMQIGKDVWLVGHCIISPIVAADRSMAMVGSVVTKDMAFNTIYAGSPATEISSRIGHQFVSVPLEDKLRLMDQYLQETGLGHKIRIVSTRDEVKADDEITYFVISTRTYTKRSTPDEIAFMKFLLPARAKFTPEVLHPR